MVDRKWAYRELFDSETEAAVAYDTAVWRLKPRDAKSYVNFKDRVLSPARAGVRKVRGQARWGITASVACMALNSGSLCGPGRWAMSACRPCIRECRCIPVVSSNRAPCVCCCCQSQSCISIGHRPSQGRRTAVHLASKAVMPPCLPPTPSSARCRAAALRVGCARLGRHAISISPEDVTGRDHRTSSAGICRMLQGDDDDDDVDAVCLSSGDLSEGAPAVGRPTGSMSPDRKPRFSSVVKVCLVALHLPPCHRLHRSVARHPCQRGAGKLAV